jgi:hypothetical protein
MPRMRSKPKYPQGSVKVLNGSGHAVIEYDLDTKEGVDEANEAIGGFASRGVFDAKTREQIDKPRLGTHEEYLVVPPMAGGR